MKTFREFVTEAKVDFFGRSPEEAAKMDAGDSSEAQRAQRRRNRERIKQFKQGRYQKSGETRTPPQGEPFKPQGKPGSSGNTQVGRKPGFKMPNVKMPNVKLPKPTPGQAAVGALNVGLGALDYKQRRDAGQTRTQAGSGAAASTAGGQAGWMTGARLGGSLPIPHPLGRAAATVTGGILGGMLGSSGAAALSDKLTGVGKPRTEKDFDKAKQKIGMTSSRKIAAQAGTYGARQGSALTGLGKDTKVDKKSGTLTTQGKTVKLASTQLVRDPKTGQQRVGDLAYKGGQAVYLARPSVPSRDVGLGGALKNLSRATGIGGQRERDVAAAKQEYRTALKNTQDYTKGLGISTKSATAQKLPGYGTAPAPKPNPVITPVVKPAVAGGGMGGRRGGGSNPSVKK